MQLTNIYNAVVYARTSKDDMDSSTINNQFELMKDYVKSKPEIKIVSERVDNGFSGVDFLRPSFIEMIKDIESGKINCVIVKDLSRLGRNYIEVGELMEEIFPRLNVRLISINDNYDSLTPRNYMDDIIIPFKNLINEQYLRDFSIKIRSNLNTKRKNGDFVSSFTPYGYKRSENNKYRLIVDEYASSIVRDIFKWKIAGMSNQKIADKLNEVDEPSPYEYKKRKGSKFTTVFQTHTRAKWSAVAVGRILQNPVYIGTLIQGKETTANYKIKKRIIKPKNEWFIAEDVHEAIIDKSDFKTVSKILFQDTRISPKNKIVLALAGILHCGDCGNNLVRKRVGKYFYYVCATNKAGKGCKSHSLKPSEIESTVMEVITQQISAMLEIENCLDYLRGLSYIQENIMKKNNQILERENEIKECKSYKQSLYEDYKNADISKEDYIEFGEYYTKRIDELQVTTDKLKKELELLLEGDTSSHKLIEYFKHHHNVTELSRQLVVNLIEGIDVFEGRRIIISLRYQDKMELLK